MECAKLLNIVGICLGLIGVIIIFFWGPPQPDLDEGIAIVLENNTVIDDQGTTVLDHDRKVLHRRRCHNIMSRIGLGFVFLGFVFQLWSTLTD